MTWLMFGIVITGDFLLLCAGIIVGYLVGSRR